MRFLISILFCLSLSAISSSSFSERIEYGYYKCPEDGCSLVYTGKDDWCVGVKCRHVKYYSCGCCGNEYGIYE